MRFPLIKFHEFKEDTTLKVILLMALTVDGKIAKTSDHYPDWTGRGDKRLFAEISRRAGLVIMGSKTYDTIGKPLPGRQNIVMTRNKTRRSEYDNLLFSDDFLRYFSKKSTHL